MPKKAGKTSAESAQQQTAAEIAAAIEAFLAEHPDAQLLESGSVLFDLRSARYTVSAEHDRCTLHLWSDERNLVRRVVAVTPRQGTLRLATLRFGQSKPVLLDLVAAGKHRTPTGRDTARQRFLPVLQKMLLRAFDGWKADDFRSARDLEKSFGPAYARGVLHRGQDAWAVIAVNAEETPATVDGVLTAGILWLHHCREHAGGRRLFRGLRIILPAGTAAATLHRMAWLHPDAAQWELYEYDPRELTDLIEREAQGTGNLATQLTHLPNPERAMERFAVALQQALAIVPEAMLPKVEQRLRSATELALLLHGLPFAHIRQRAAMASFTQTMEIMFGAGAEETPLTAATEPKLREFVRELFLRRHPGGSPTDQLFRMSPEAWLESSLRANIKPLSEGQGSLAQFDHAHVYAQVAAFGAGDHGAVDLMTRTRDGRIALIELKADEDMHMALQGLDYWLRVRAHHNSLPDAMSGLGALQHHGYFRGTQLSPLPPRLYFVAPALRIHPATEIILRYIHPQVEWCLLGLNEKWREGVRVITRQRSASFMK